MGSTPQPLTALLPGIWVGQSALYATNSGVLISDGYACLIDPGLGPEELQGITDLLAEQGAVAQAVVITHWHWDHITGVAAFPTADVVSQARYREVMGRHAADLRRQIAAWEAQMGMRRSEPFALPRPTRVFEDRLVFGLGHRSIELIHAPGHTPEQCVAYLPDAGLLWAADMLSDVELPLVAHDPTAYAETLRSLALLEIAALVPGHGSPTTDRREIATRLTQDLTYLEALGDCVAAALRRGDSLARTVDMCKAVPFAQPDTYPYAHRWNIETAYVSLGGRATALVGWDHEWLADL